MAELRAVPQQYFMLMYRILTLRIFTFNKDLNSPREPTLIERRACTDIRSNG